MRASVALLRFLESRHCVERVWWNYYPFLEKSNGQKKLGDRKVFIFKVPPWRQTIDSLLEPLQIFSKQDFLNGPTTTPKHIRCAPIHLTLSFVMFCHKRYKTPLAIQRARRGSQQTRIYVPDIESTSWRTTIWGEITEQPVGTQDSSRLAYGPYADWTWCFPSHSPTRITQCHNQKIIQKDDPETVAVNI